MGQTGEPTKYKMIPRRKTDEGVSRLEFSEEAYEEAKGILKCRFSGEKKVTSELLTCQEE